MEYLGRHELWGSEIGQNVRLDIQQGSTNTMIVRQGNPGPVSMTLITNFCPLDIDLSGMVNILDFSAFLNQYAAGFGDWNVDGIASVTDFVDFLNAWASDPCVP
jgi:hypothetical protein